MTEYTKNRDWDFDADGAAPVLSRRHAGKKAVVLDGDDGTFFGWEDEDGKLYVGTRLSFDANAQAMRDAKAVEGSNMAAEKTARANTFAVLKAKRENGEVLTQDDIHALADLFLGVDLT
jgi:hypothetical protein